MPPQPERNPPTAEAPAPNTIPHPKGARPGTPHARPSTQDRPTQGCRRHRLPPHSTEAWQIPGEGVPRPQAAGRPSIRAEKARPAATGSQTTHPPPEPTAHHPRTGAPPPTSPQTDPGKVKTWTAAQQSTKTYAQGPGRAPHPWQTGPRVHAHHPPPVTQAHGPHEQDQAPPDQTARPPSSHYGGMQATSSTAPPPGDCRIPPKLTEVPTAQVSPREAPQATPPA
ncbi:uncharacterized protein LOC129187522 [Dunckerocampus dactyliophorus]|uniref:uncharacterized protein LOC129187522 n=1 Tax=Dunckerocampus dactyliophorus TaxID=161453 RepID=UPI002406CF31|nr:uncharacterized protein LOC129187522 [Dunckerocampus dactyliophorus]